MLDGLCDLRALNLYLSFSFSINYYKWSPSTTAPSSFPVISPHDLATALAISLLSPVNILTLIPALVKV
jgi:hypothetical protein